MIGGVLSPEYSPRDRMIFSGDVLCDNSEYESATRKKSRDVASLS